MGLPQPRLVLRTADLERSLPFYRDQLGCTEEWSDPARGVARVRLPGGSLLLLAAATADVTDLLDPEAREQPRTKRLYVRVPDVRVLHRRLAEQGAPVISFTNDPYDPTLLAEDPDGYLLHIWMHVDLTDDEILDLYRRGPALLEEALQGLSEADLDLVRAPGKWSIRQTVLHLADEELNMTHRLKFALAEPGREYRGNPVTVPDLWVAGLDYAHRPIAAEVALFRVMREHMGALVEHLDGALERAVLNGQGARFAVREGLRLAATHAWSHIQQIRETRVVHGR